MSDRELVPCHLSRQTDKKVHMYTVAFERGNRETPGTSSRRLLVEGDPDEAVRSLVEGDPDEAVRLLVEGDPDVADLESSQPAAATPTWSREARGEGNADIDARRSDISA